MEKSASEDSAEKAESAEPETLVLAEPAAESPVVKAASEPAADSAAAEPIAEPIDESAVDADEPTVKLSNGKAAQNGSAPVDKLAAAGTSEPAAHADPVADPVVEPIAAPKTVAVDEPALAGEPVTEPVAAAEPVAAPEPVIPAQAIITAEPDLVGTPAPVAQPDDLTKIPGIGPKVAMALAAAGITTYAKLADSDVTSLKQAINAAGMRGSASLATWPERARQMVGASS